MSTRNEIKKTTRRLPGLVRKANNYGSLNGMVLVLLIQNRESDWSFAYRSQPVGPEFMKEVMEAPNTIHKLPADIDHSYGSAQSRKARINKKTLTKDSKKSSTKSSLRLKTLAPIATEMTNPVATATQRSIVQFPEPPVFRSTVLVRRSEGRQS